MTTLTDSSLTNAREIMMITEAQREQTMVGVSAVVAETGDGALVAMVTEAPPPGVT